MKKEKESIEMNVFSLLLIVFLIVQSNISTAANDDKALALWAEALPRITQEIVES